MLAARHDTILADERHAARRHAGLVGVIALVCIASLWITGFFYAQRLIDVAPALAQLFREMVPPDFTRWQHWLKPLLDTLAMSVAGTVLARAFSLPLALLAASNTSPHALVYQSCRIVLSFLRSVPEIIMGIIFVAAVGFGALPGVLALGLHSVGMVGKFYAEAIEHVDPRPIEAARAAGASPFQVITHAVLPQVLPQLADITIYRWEYHFRASAVLGIVGAGGIGFEFCARGDLRDEPPNPPRCQEAEMIIATRVLKLRRPDGYVDVPVHIFAPEQKDGGGAVELKSVGQRHRNRSTSEGVSIPST